LNHY